jgi:hypothetical protein
VVAREIGANRYAQIERALYGARILGESSQTTTASLALSDVSGVAIRDRERLID